MKTCTSILAILCGVLMSCQSPNEPYQKPSTVPIVEQNIFGPSFSSGMTWNFSYSYRRDDGLSGYTLSLTGIHQWIVISSSISKTDTTFELEQIRNDTKRYKSSFFDSTSVVQDTTYFQIVVSSSTIKFNWPLYDHIEMDQVPNHIKVDSLPVSFHYGPWYDQNGPFGYDYYWHPMGYLEISEKLTLVSFIKP